MKFEAVLFDLDGTLLDTLEDLATSVNAVLRRYDYPEYSTEQYCYMVGDGIEVLVRKSLPEEKCQQEHVKEIVNLVQEEYRNCWKDTTCPYPGVNELLNGLEDKNIPKAILSNKPYEFTVLTVETLLPHWKFAVIEGVREGVIRKPDPSGALAIAEQLRIEPAKFVYLGDTSTDMQTAVAAGMYPVGALWGFRSAQELKENGAEILVESPVDVLSLF